MLKIGGLQKRKIIDNHLKEIEGVSFTDRQIDVLACLVHLRNYGKMATILGINSIRTVQTHVNHIRTKLGNIPVEHVVDFIEKSGKRRFFVIYYFHILVEYSFRKKLLKLKSLLNRETVNYVQQFDIVDGEKGQLLQIMIDHLKVANIEPVKSKSLTDKAIVLHSVLSSNGNGITQNEFAQKTKKNNVRDVYLLLGKTVGGVPSHVECSVDFSDESDYYFSLFRLIEILSGNKSVVQGVEEEFREEYVALQKSWDGSDVKDSGFVQRST